MQGLGLVGGHQLIRRDDDRARPRGAVVADNVLPPHFTVRVLGPREALAPLTPTHTAEPLHVELTVRDDAFQSQPGALVNPGGCLTPGQARVQYYQRDDRLLHSGLLS